jgi:hypothetical protein
MAIAFETMVATVVTFSSDRERLEIMFGFLLLRHVHYKVRPEMFPLLKQGKQAVLVSLENWLGDEWDARLE